MDKAIRLSSEIKELKLRIGQFDAAVSNKSSIILAGNSEWILPKHLPEGILPTVIQIIAVGLNQKLQQLNKEFNALQD